MKMFRNICCLLAFLMIAQVAVAADFQEMEDEARDNLQMSLLEFMAKNDNFNVSEDEINATQLAENKTLKMSITLFMMSMYGIVVSGDNTVEEIKVEVFNEDGKSLMTKMINSKSRDVITLNAEYTGEYQVNITPVKINSDDDYFRVNLHRRNIDLILTGVFCIERDYISALAVNHLSHKRFTVLIKHFDFNLFNCVVT